MTSCDDTKIESFSVLSRLVTALLVLLAQVVAALLIGSVALAVSPTHAAELRSAAFIKPGDARSGSLLLKNGDNTYADATRLGIDVDLTVSGPTIRARVTQLFRNPTKDWMEATYVYPLPEGGAVDTLKMVVGDRVIVGDIKERQQARAIYDQARQNGQKAALSEQERPNIFTDSVANIGPGETVLVQIEYQEPVHQSGNEFSMRVPMVVGPRYNPAPVVQSVDLRDDGSGWGTSTSDPVPDRDRISPRVLDPAENAPVNPTSITVRLQAGFPLGEEPRRRDAHHSPRRRLRAGRSRFRADLEACRREGAIGRFVPRACRRRRLRSGLCHAAFGRAGRAEAAPARSDLRDRQFRFDGRNVH